jgi:acyl-CoA reductase-like NAD-dependent aldehyde dehydrogenase
MAVTAGEEIGLFIDGELVEPASGELRELVEPASGEPLARAAMAGEADIDRAVAAARAALEGPWGKTPPTERARLLHALADAIVANRKELAELETRNVGKALSSVKAEVAGAAENFRFFASVAGSIAGRSNPIGGSLLTYSLKEPVGVCAQIVPWNYPLLMAVWKLSPALAAGCTVVLRLCSEPIKRLTLELGGKSPNLVFADANLDDAIPSSVWSIYASAGQSCEARSRVLVEKPLYDEFVSRFADYAKQVKVGDPLDPETQVGSLISSGHRDRVHGYVEKGREEGAEVLAGGEFGPGAGAFYLPTVLAGVDNAMTVAQEEIFGPVVTAIPFEDETDAIRIANDVRYGLFATVWTGDPARGHRVARAIKSGMVGINMPYTAFPGIPFGGYKQSGFGRELSIDTLELYLETKGVLFSTSAKPSNPFGL